MKLVILGAGGLAREVQQLVSDINYFNDGLSQDPLRRYVLKEKIELLGFVDENKENHGKTVHNIPVLGGFEWLRNAGPEIQLALGVGFPRIKKKFVTMLQELGLDFQFPTLVHPTANIGDNVKLGWGALVMMNNSITVDITIGDYALINQGCSIGHDTVIGQFASLAPHCVISGYTEIGEGADLGSNVVTKPGVKIGDWSAVGLQAGVVKDIPAKVVAIGCPAKPIKTLDE